MENYVNEGDVVALVAPRALKSGDGFIVGQLFAVATVDVAAGGTVPGVVEGLVDLPKVPGGAWAAGAKISWDDAAQQCALTGDLSIGLTVRDEPSTDPGPVRVKLIPSIVLPS